MTRTPHPSTPSSASTDDHAETNFITDLQKAINSILTKHPTTTIAIQGDINIDLLRLTPRHAFTHFLLEKYDPQHKTATLIDVVQQKQTPPSQRNTLTPPSDHLPIYAIFHKPTARRKLNTQKTLRVHKTQTEHPHQNQDSNITDTKRRPTTHQHHNSFHNLQQALQETIQTFEKRPRPPRKPWWRPRFRRQIRKQHRLKHRSARSL